MNVLVAYATRLGSTAGIARRIGDRLESHGLAVTVREVASVEDVTAYDAVVLGSAVYAGRLLEPIIAFADRHRARLTTVPVWVFCSGPVGRMATSLAPSIPPELEDIAALLRARGRESFAGALDRDTIDGAGFGVGERFIAKHFVPEGDCRDWDAIDAWADRVALGLTAAPSAA